MLAGRSQRMVGVNLTLREDSSTSYADPAVNEYSTITATGVITDAFRGVPSPSGLSATAGLKSNELNWVNPAKPNDFGTIYVYASPNANFSSAVKIGETDGTQFIHDASNSADSVVSGDVRYYWVRAVRNVGTDAASQSNLEPNADPNTTVFATVGRVEWADVSGSTDAPEDNATVGATLSENLYDIDEVTFLVCQMSKTKLSLILKPKTTLSFKPKLAIIYLLKRLVMLV